MQSAGSASDSDAASVNVGGLLSVCVQASAAAGEIIRSFQRSGFQTEFKSDESPVTQADINAQKLIVALLRKYRSNLVYVGEEDASLSNASDPPTTDLQPDDSLVDCSLVPEEYQSVPLAELCVFIDPLDGTREFVRGNWASVTTLIGIAVRGLPVAGVIGQPFGPLGNGEARTVYGMPGVGLHGIERQQRRLGALTLTVSSTAALEARTAAIGCDDILWGSGTGFKSLLVLGGDADVFLHSGTYLWDICAPAALLAVLGGTCTDLHGHAVPFESSVSTRYEYSDGGLMTLGIDDSGRARIYESLSTVRNSN
eukprot:TRINITY_DN9020_c0_g1_i1.p1 TRINITY_DN9020_c0_g1~~TRINITY_DN9020_c0_g1_i1.p1  ORF type:complete len:312 (+),score=76.10 TRINITY_DN9020_c0_g1_i1:144-1079(+)